ncbi:MAG: hypothetical protein JWP29_5521 [Rhodoferax sp.]|nr:hypothetical protein [Rhodoferax sp.]
MNAAYGARAEGLGRVDEDGVVSHASVSGVSWGAIFAGAAGAAALSLILLILGTGLGLSSVSPWAQSGIDAGTFGVSTIIWITFTQLAASGMGGYLAGRLRSKWVGVHTDETYFRDTAHGFLAWSVATLVTAAMLTSAIGAIVSGGAKAGASGAGSAATAAVTAGAAAAAGSTSSASDSNSYFIDSLFRKAASPQAAPQPDAVAPNAGASSAGAPVPNASDVSASTAEVARIFSAGLSSSAALPADDVKYVGQVVAQRAGISQADAEKRVTDTYAKAQAKIEEAKTQAKDAADKARKASAYAALWLFVSLLAGAFVASLAATYGGRRRDL